MGKAIPLLGTLAFGAIGGAVGGTFGANIGMMIGGMIFAQPQPANSSSVADLKVTVAEPAFLPIVVGDDIPDPQAAGKFLQGGVWLPGKIVKVPQKGGVANRKERARKGRGGTTGRLYGAPKGGGVKQFLSCAYAWCEGSLEAPGRLRELRLDDKIYYREGAKSNEEGYIARTFVYDALGNEVGWTSDTIHHFYGTQTQPADDVLTSWYDGDGGPALRGTCYTVLIGVEITDFGHVPNSYARIGNGINARIEQCRFFLNRANGLDGEGALPMSAVQLSKISGYSRGWFMTQTGAPRQIAELIASRSFCSLVEHSYRIWDVDLANPTIHDLENWELGAKLQSGDGESEGGARFKRGRGGSAPLASKVEVRYADSRKRDENTVSAVLPTALQENVMTFDLPTVDVQEDVQAWAQVTLDAAHISRITGEVSALPRRLDVLPGDVIRVPRLALEEPLLSEARARDMVTLLVRERTLGLPGPLELSGVGWSELIYRNVPRIVPPPEPVEATAYGAPILFVAATVALERDSLGEGGVIVAASQKAGLKWGKGARVEIDYQRGGSWKEVDGYDLDDRAVMGEVLSAWQTSSPYDGYVNGNALTVEMLWGALATAPSGGVRGGANTLLFENGLVISFTTALQIGLTQWGEGRYELDGIKSGRWGSDAIVTPGAVIPAGTRCVLMTDEVGAEVEGIRFDGQDSRRLGSLHRARGWMQEKSNLQATPKTFPFEALNMKPLAPTGVRALLDESGALHLSGRARTRDLRADGWNTAGIESTEPRKNQGFEFSIQLVAGGQTRVETRFTLDDGASFDWVWSASDLSALFGNAPSALSGAVAMQGRYGSGFQTQWVAN